MYTATTIEEFHTLLSGQKRSDSKLMSLLRELMDTISPDDIVKLATEAIIWADWRSIER